MDATLSDGNKNYQPTKSWIQRHPKNLSGKKWCCRLVYFTQISLQRLKMLLNSLCGPHVLVCTADNIRAGSQWGSLGDLLPDFYQHITDSWTIWGATWGHRANQNIMLSMYIRWDPGPTAPGLIVGPRIVSQCLMAVRVLCPSLSVGSSMDMPPQSITASPSDWSCWNMLHIILHSFLRPFHICHMWSG